MVKVKVQAGEGEVVPANAMKVYGGRRCVTPLIPASALHKGEWLNSRPGRLTFGTHWTEGWVGARAGQDFWKRETFLDCAGNRTPDRRGQSVDMVPTTLSRPQ
jgi:hypothetical protein